METHAGSWEPVSPTLHDMTHLLESADGAPERVRRVLGLLRNVVPYDQCAILDARLGFETQVVLVPEPSPDERATLTRSLLGLFGFFVDADVGASAPPARNGQERLAVPLVGLDEVVGLLYVSSATGEYTEEHLRTLSLVAAKLAVYFTTLRSRAELAQLARERDEARRAAEAANRAKDEFLALVSYELKTPLISILASARVLDSSVGDDVARTRAMGELERSVSVQANLIDELLYVAGMASASLRLSLHTTEVAGLIRETIEGLRLEAERKSIRLESHLDAATMPLVVDPDRIGQIVSILVGNAIKFTPAGGHIEVCLERAAGHARIRVSDSGSGISSEALPHVFDRFAETGAAGARGLGVGLAIVKDIVALHGGRVRAESDGPGRGSTFTIELPHAPPRNLPAAGDSGDGRMLAGVTVLLVDYDVGVREIFQSVLSDYGAVVTSVASGPAALAAIDRALPDVLLFGDLAPHEESVYELLRQVTARTNPLPIASISAWRKEEKERELAAGFKAHLSQPLQISSLVNAIAALAGRTPAKKRRAE